MQKQSAELSEGWEASEPGARGSNQTGVRAYNERLVLTLIRQKGALSKSEIARITGLSAQTVSVIMRHLEADGLLVKGEPVRGRIGQPSIPMNLRDDGAFFFGLKVGRRSVDLILVDFTGNIRGRTHFLHRYPDPDQVVSFTNIAVKQLLDRLTEVERARVAGLGIAIPFRLWDWAQPLGVEDMDMKVWRNRDIRAELAGNWQFPVYLQNDASSACGAELVFGTGERPSDFLYFFVGFFIGGGLVLNNNLYTGRFGNAAALGSMPVWNDGKKTVSLLEVASLAGLEAELTRGGLSGDMIWQSPHDWTIPAALLDEWVNTAAKGMAFAAASAAIMLDLGCVVVDGWLPAKVRTELVRATQHHLSGIGVVGAELPTIQEGSIGSDARSLGAASLPLSERFLVDKSAGIAG
ncbi:MAG: ROK family transcriptional regulator [Rhizobiaceae bacterium]|nr:ROK family transcriptional regulator [Rhizobiaceae bacterium]